MASQAERLANDLGDAVAVWIGDIQRWELARFTGVVRSSDRRSDAMRAVRPHKDKARAS